MSGSQQKQQEQQLRLSRHLPAGDDLRRAPTSNWKLALTVFRSLPGASEIHLGSRLACGLKAGGPWQEVACFFLGRNSLWHPTLMTVSIWGIDLHGRWLRASLKSALGSLTLPFGQEEFAFGALGVGICVRKANLGPSSILWCLLFARPERAKSLHA